MCRGQQAGTEPRGRRGAAGESSRLQPAGSRGSVPAPLLPSVSLSVLIYNMRIMWCPPLRGMVIIHTNACNVQGTS